MRHYKYNFAYLAEWLEKHPKMKNKVAAAIGTSAASLDRWLVDLNNPHHRANRLDRNGKKVGPISMERMLAFCNHFDVDLSCFFLQSDMPADISPADVNEIKYEEKPVTADHGVYMPSDGLKDVHENDMLRLRLNHIQEIQHLQQEAREREESLRREYQQREDQLRRDYEERLEELKDMVRDGMQTTRLALTQGDKLKEHIDYGSGYGVSEGHPMPRPVVHPKKR